MRTWEPSYFTLVNFGTLERAAYPKIPPWVEDHLTKFGMRFVEVFDQMERLRVEFGG